MEQIKPGEMAPHDGFYITRGYSVFLRQGQVMPVVRPEYLDIETESSPYILENMDEQG